MVKRKKIRTRGKIPLSKMFQNLVTGQPVAVVREVSVDAGFPDRIQGRTGTVVSKRGHAYIVKIKDHDKEKTFIIRPVHLRKIENKK